RKTESVDAASALSFWLLDSEFWILFFLLAPAFSNRNHGEGLRHVTVQSASLRESFIKIEMCHCRKNFVQTKHLSPNTEMQCSSICRILISRQIKPCVIAYEIFDGVR